MLGIQLLRVRNEPRSCAHNTRARRKHRVRRTPPEDPGAQTCKSLPRRVGGASRSSCRVLCAQVQPVITWGSCLRGRGSRWRSWRITPPAKKASRARRHRRRARATASSQRASSTARRPAHSTSPAAIDPGLPPPRRADTRRSVEDGGERQGKDDCLECVICSGMLGCSGCVRCSGMLGCLRCVRCSGMCGFKAKVF